MITFSIHDGKMWLRHENEETVFSISLEDARHLRRNLDLNHRAMRPAKDWDNCPYEGHANDCTCNGMGGDR